MSASFQVKAVNICGLGIHRSSKYRTHPIPYKIKEIVSSAKYIPTVYGLLETQLRCDHRRIKLPRGIRYLGETSGDRNEGGGSGGIFLIHDSTIEILNKKQDINVIISEHAMYAKITYFDVTLNLIFVYLPHETKQCLESLAAIDKFIEKKKLDQFMIIGDFNISFESKKHTTKINRLRVFLHKYNLFDIGDRLGVRPDFTWRGRGDRIQSKSTIDYAYGNFDFFNKISYDFNSFSDHKTITLGVKKNYIYRTPKWKAFLFNNNEFIKLMKEETIKFLASNSDEGNLPDLDEILEKDNFVNLDFSFENLEYKSTTAFFALTKHLKQVHDKFYSKFRLRNFIKVKEFDEKIKKMYKDIDSSFNIDKQKEVKQLIEQQQDYFKKLVHTREEINHIKMINLDGKSNSLTYRHIRRSKGINHSLLINGKNIENPQEIANIFAKQHAEIVSPKVVPDSNLEEMLKNYGLSLDMIYPQITTLSSAHCTTNEFIEVINTMSNSSAPGITSEPKALYKFFFDFLPEFSTNALNRIYDIDIDLSPFKYIKDRNICFIPKKDTDLNNPKNFRPISLCETSYKILTKAIARKVGPYMSKIIHSEQFGFTKGRQMSTATTSILATLDYLKSHKIDAQLLAVDIEKAYDKVLNSVATKIIEFVFPNGNFAKSWNKLSCNGRFRAIVKNNCSKFYDVLVSIAQGRPDATIQYNMVHHIFMSCLESEPIKKISLKIGSKHIPCGSFADDTWKFLSLKTYSDVEIVKNLLIRMEESIGLKVNFSKTKLLVNGKNPPGVEALGQICPVFKHLGVFIGVDSTEAANQTYKELIDKLEIKAKNFPMKYGFSILKRRNVCLTILNSMGYHIFRIYKPNEEQLKKLSKITNKFLWSIDKIDGISFRFKVAKNRIQTDFSQGGLNILTCENQTFKVWLPSFINCLKHAVQYKDSTLKILFDHKQIPVEKLMDNFGFHHWNENLTKLKSMQSVENVGYFEKAKLYFRDLEADKSVILYTPLTSLSYFNVSNVEYFSKDEIDELKYYKLITVASILEFNQIDKNRIVVLPMLKKSLLPMILSQTLVNKLSQIASLTREKFSVFDSIHINKHKKMHSPIVHNSTELLTFHFKRLIKDSINIAHPAIRSRQREGIYFPDIESYEFSLKKMFELPLMIHYKSFFYEQISRTLTSKNKLAKFGLAENNLCPKCKVVSNLEHALYECILPDFFSHTLARFLDVHLNEGKPEFIFLKENLFLFNIYFEQFSKNEYLQISLITLVAKEKCLQLSKDDRLEKWNKFNCISQSILIAQFTSKLLTYANLNDDIIMCFHDFLIEKRDSF